MLQERCLAVQFPISLGLEDRMVAINSGFFLFLFFFLLVVLTTCALNFTDMSCPDTILTILLIGQIEPLYIVILQYNYPNVKTWDQKMY
jgi:hypothetical protein